MLPLRFLGLLPLVSIALLPFVPSQSQQASPPLPAKQTFDSPPPPVVAGTPVKAALVRSWSAGGASAWSELNSEWPSYGSVPILIDFSLAGVSSFTYADLVATNADVIILSDPSGGLVQFSQAEIAALRDYALAGHDVIGTFLTFGWDVYDNRDLAGIFGLAVQAFPTVDAPTSNHFMVPKLWHALFADLGAHSWHSNGYPRTQSTADGIWNSLDLNGAKILSQADGFEAIVSVYRHERYTAVYFSNMPEYFGTTQDKQLLYNAIALPKHLAVAVTK